MQMIIKNFMPPAGFFAFLSGAQVLRGPSVKFGIFLSLMKHSSNSSERREWRKVQSTNDSAQGDGAAGISSELCRMRKGGVTWVLFNEFWYIGIFLS